MRMARAPASPAGPRVTRPPTDIAPPQPGRLVCSVPFRPAGLACREAVAAAFASGALPVLPPIPGCFQTMIPFACPVFHARGLRAAWSLAAAALLAACGGGEPAAPDGGDGVGTLRLSLTDAPACGYREVFVTVERVRVHRSSSAEPDDAGWREVVLPAPQRVDLLELTNGTLLPLGQLELPAGAYTQMRLVLSPNTAAAPLANAVTPLGGTTVALTTPSAARSGLKMNVSLQVPAGQVADVAIDFDACRSLVRAGKSGKVLLKPVLRVIPIISPAGQRVVGYVDPALATGTTTVSVQSAGVPVRATPPDPAGRFVLYPVPPGRYDLVVTAPGRVNAVMTDVPVSEATTTLVGHVNLRLDPPAVPLSHEVSGTVTVRGATADTGGAVRALQTFTGGPVVEVGHAAADDLTGAYALTLPAGAPVRAVYAAGASGFGFTPDAAAAGRYRLEAAAPGYAAQGLDVELTGDVTRNFGFGP